MALHLHTSLCYLHEAPIILRSFNKPSSAAPASCTQPDLPPDCQTRDAHPAIHGVLELVRQFDNTKIHNLRCSVSVGKQRFFFDRKVEIHAAARFVCELENQNLYSPKNPNSQVHQRQIRNWAAFKFRPWSPTVMCMGPTILIGNLDPNLNLVFRKKCFGEIWIPKPHTLQPISSRCVNARGDTWREGPMSFVFRCSCGCLDSSRKMVRGQRL